MTSVVLQRKSNDYEDPNEKSRRRRPKLSSQGVPVLLATAIVSLVSYFYLLSASTKQNHRRENSDGITKLQQQRTTKVNEQHYAPMGTIAYGPRDGGIRTAEYVRDAIVSEFRHVVTATYHIDHNETGVGEGWTEAAEKLILQNQNDKLKREDLFFQTMFVPFHSPNYNAKGDVIMSRELPLEDQVKHTIERSLVNLRTTYLDAVIYQNFRNKLQPFDEMLSTWRILETYAQKGIVRHLGISNVHDVTYLTNLLQNSTIQPAIIQNRFHKNRNFDAELRRFLQEHNVRSQTFWVLAGNGGAIRRDAGMMRLAKEFNVTTQQLTFAFVVSLGFTPLIGTHRVQHMMDDVMVAKWHDNTKADDCAIFLDVDSTDEDRRVVAKAIGMDYVCVKSPKECSSLYSKNTRKNIKNEDMDTRPETQCV